MNSSLLTLSQSRLCINIELHEKRRVYFMSKKFGLWLDDVRIIMTFWYLLGKLTRFHVWFYFTVNNDFMFSGWTMGKC